MDGPQTGGRRLAVLGLRGAVTQRLPSPRRHRRPQTPGGAHAGAQAPRGGQLATSRTAARRPTCPDPGAPGPASPAPSPPWPRRPRAPPPRHSRRPQRSPHVSRRFEANIRRQEPRLVSWTRQPSPEAGPGRHAASPALGGGGTRPARRGPVPPASSCLALPLSDLE